MLKPNNFRIRNRKVLFASAVFGLLTLIAIQAYTAENYPDPNHPFYSGNFAVNTPVPVQALTVMSYNIWFGLNPEQALLELKEINSQTELDIILLQEMDEVGAEQIARGLQMNYVYYPAAVEPTYNKNFGNAILSRWPILDSHKFSKSRNSWE